MTGGLSTDAIFHKPLHVVTLAPFYPSAGDDASGCFISEPLPSLENLGIHNTVFAAQPFYRRQKKKNPLVYHARHYRYPAIPGGLGLPVAGAFLFSRLLAPIRKLHRTNPIHLIHAHAALPCGHAAVLLSRELKIPFVVTVHGLDAYFTEQVHRRAGQWCKHICKFVYGSAACVVCISEKVRNSVLEAAAPQVRTEVVYNSVDTTLFAPASESPEDDTVLSVGNLIPVKDHELLLRSFAEIHQRFPSLSCEIIGDGPERFRLETLAVSLGIDRSIRFFGRRSHAEVAEAMRRCLLFALPSRYEGLGCVYLEAMATAKPVIGCLAQGIDEVIEHGVNGILISPGNQSELTAAMSALITNRPLRGEMGDAARRTILRDFTLERHAEHLAQIYRDRAQLK